MHQLLGERLKELRLDKSMSQQQLAALCGVTRSTISFYETNRSEPSDEIKKIIASYFNVSLDYLCGYSDIRNPEALHNVNDSILVKIPVLDHSNPKKILNHTYVSKDRALQGSYFFVKVIDNFMLNARIFPNDLVYIKKQSFVNNNDIVALLLSTNKITFRRTIRLNDLIFFLSENPDTSLNYTYKDVESGNIKILGKVLQVLFDV